MLFNRYFLCLLFSLLFMPTVVSAGEVTLNFRDTEIRDLIHVISEVTGKTFVVDPRVRAKITVVSSKPMNSNQVYQVFLSILSVHGFTAVPSGAVIKIIPENLARSQNTPVLLNNETAKGEEIVTQIVEIKHVSARQLVPLLRPLINQQGHLVAHPENNTIIISDHASNVRRLLKIIHRIDKPQDNAVEVIILEQASAAEVVQTLARLDKKTKVKNTPNIIADERTNSLIISGDKATRLRLRSLIAHLDTPIKKTGKTQVISLRYAQAKDLVKVLKGVSESLVFNNQAKNKKKIKVNIQADETSNSLIITAPAAIQENLEKVIRKLDVRRAQVLVEAIIAEISTDTAQKLGVQWALYGVDGTTPFGLSNFDNAGTTAVELGTAAASGGTSLPSVGAGAFFGLGRFNSNILNFGVLIQALASDTNSNVLSTPSLLTLDNHEAEIVVGQNVPFVTGQYSSTGGTSNVANPFQTIQREDIGIKLKVKPQINDGNAVLLEIEQEVSSISRSSQTASDLVTNKRSIKTTVIVEDGSMVVLGGLIDEDLQQTKQKVPLLGDLPIVGGLFRSQSTQKVKRNLMIFLHPIIIRTSATQKSISRKKYSAMRIKQLEQKAEGVGLMSAEELPVLPDLNDFLTTLPGMTAKEMEPQLYK